MGDDNSMRQLPAAAYKRLKRAFRDLYEECGGCEAAARTTRACKTSINNWGSTQPHRLKEFPPIDVVADLEAECGRSLVSDVLADLAGEGAAPHRPGDPLDRMGAIAKEFGEAAGEYRAFVGNPSGTQATATLREINEAIEELQAAARDVESTLEQQAAPRVAMYEPQRRAN